VSFVEAGFQDCVVCTRPHTQLCRKAAAFSVESVDLAATFFARQRKETAKEARLMGTAPKRCASAILSFPARSLHIEERLELGHEAGPLCNSQVMDICEEIELVPRLAKVGAEVLWQPRHNLFDWFAAIDDMGGPWLPQVPLALIELFKAVPEYGVACERPKKQKLAPFRLFSEVANKRWDQCPSSLVFGTDDIAQRHMVR
jgi:hypothetical protein